MPLHINYMYVHLRGSVTVTEFVNAERFALWHQRSQFSAEQYIEYNIIRSEILNDRRLYIGNIKPA